MANLDAKRLVDLSHLIEAEMTTYKGLPGPHICDYWTREHSAAFYENGETFHIGRIDMVANTGTYLDAPFHRYADGADLAGLELNQLASLNAPSLATFPAVAEGRWRDYCARAILGSASRADGRRVGRSKRLRSEINCVTKEAGSPAASVEMRAAAIMPSEIASP